MVHPPPVKFRSETILRESWALICPGLPTASRSPHSMELSSHSKNTLESRVFGYKFSVFSFFFLHFSHLMWLHHVTHQLNIWNTLAWGPVDFFHRCNMRCNQNIPRSFSTRSSSQQCLASFTPVLKHFPLCDIRLVCRVKRQYWLLFETILNDHGSCFSGYDLQHFLLACTLISSLRADGLCRTVACVILFHYRAHWKYWSFFLGKKKNRKHAHLLHYH